VTRDEIKRLQDAVTDLQARCDSYEAHLIANRAQLTAHEQLLEELQALAKPRPGDHPALAIWRAKLRSIVGKPQHVAPAKLVKLYQQARKECGNREEDDLWVQDQLGHRTIPKEAAAARSAVNRNQPRKGGRPPGKR
jgi:hypothetical protein